MMADSRVVFFFDIDNCLYPKSKKVHDLMAQLINQYFITHLSLSRDEAHKLHMEYYESYGLAIEGLVRYHKIDPLEYNREVDDALPLESILLPDPELRKLLQDVDKSKVKLWLFTNAYVTHAKRVVRLLGVDDLFEGMTYCDYAAERLLCKPQPEMFAKAMKDAAVRDFSHCYFVDDSILNCTKAEETGWTTVHLVENDTVTKPCKYQVRRLEELRMLFPQFFK